MLVNVVENYKFILICMCPLTRKFPHVSDEKQRKDPVDLGCVMEMFLIALVDLELWLEDCAVRGFFELVWSLDLRH